MNYNKHQRGCTVEKVEWINMVDDLILFFYHIIILITKKKIAMKTASKELLGLIWCYNAGVEGIHFPLMSVVRIFIFLILQTFILLILFIYLF